MRKFRRRHQAARPDVPASHDRHEDDMTDRWNAVVRALWADAALREAGAVVEATEQAIRHEEDRSG